MDEYITPYWLELDFIETKNKLKEKMLEAERILVENKKCKKSPQYIKILENIMTIIRILEDRNGHISCNRCGDCYQCLWGDITE